MELTAVISVWTPHSFGSCYPEQEIPVVALHLLFGYTSQLFCELPRAGTECLTPQSAQCLAEEDSVCVLLKS